MIFGGELYRDDLNKISYILNSYQDFLDAKEAFPDLQHGTWGGKADIITDDVKQDGRYITRKILSAHTT